MPLWTSSVIVLVVSLGAFAPPALAQSGAVASAILDVKPVVFPVYDAYKGISRYAPTPEAYARAIADRGFVMERLTYRSDDLDVFAYLYRPAAPRKGERLPVVIFNRGSSTSISSITPTKRSTSSAPAESARSAWPA